MISVIIPTLNEEKIIGDTLANLQGLRRAGHEVIVSDSASTDRTREIAGRHADAVLVEPQPEKRTIARGKNRGARGAHGDFLIFIDADVAIPDPPEFAKTALSAFSENPRLVGLTGYLKVSPGQATLADRFFFGVVNIVHRLNNNVLGIGSASGEFQMIRARAFRELGGYREDLVVTEDNEFFHRLAKFGQTRFEPRLTVYHTGRRPHALGWPRVLFEWVRNDLSLKFRNRSASKEWSAIR